MHNNAIQAQQPQQPQRQQPLRQHKTYLKTEEQIGKSLALAIQHRLIDYPVTKLCQNAGISPVTFYYHYASANQALLGYEQGIKTDFLSRRPLSSTFSSEITFLLHFIACRSTYFEALFQTRNFYLLHDLLLTLQSLQPGKLIASGLSRELYFAQLEIILSYWTLVEKCSPSKLNQYLSRLCKTKLIYIE